MVPNIELQRLHDFCASGAPVGGSEYNELAGRTYLTGLIETASAAGVLLEIGDQTTRANVVYYRIEYDRLRG